MVPNLPPYSRGGEIIRILILPGNLSYYYEPWYLHPYGAATVTSSGTAVDADRNAFVMRSESICCWLAVRSTARPRAWSTWSNATAACFRRRSDAKARLSAMRWAISITASHRLSCKRHIRLDELG